MRFVRILLMAAAIFLVTSCTESATAAGVFVRVNPIKVGAGNATQIQANCGEGVNSATVTSSAFGTVTLHRDGSVLAAQATVLSTTPKGTFDVRLSCPNGAHASTTVTVLAAVIQGQAPPPVRGPGTGGGFLATGREAPDRTPYVWLGLGVGCLLAAGAIALRAKRPLRVRLRRAPASSTDEPSVPSRR